MNNAILLGSCPDRKGINAKITNFIYTYNGNIENFDQHIDSQTNTFFMRLEWSLEDFQIPKGEISSQLKPLLKEFQMDWHLYFTQKVTRMVIFVSQYTHCLYDLLLRYKNGQFSCQIPFIVSNHPQASPIARYFGLRFFEFPINPENKEAQEERELALLRQEGIELIVLARYMQILTKRFIQEYPSQIINIHHSFLPAFRGPGPYRQAYARGVKIIGATSHYVTQALDAGPIIEQDTVRVSHRDSLADLIRKGQDLEKIVLARSVKWHLERKILIYNNKTVVFD